MKIYKAILLSIFLLNITPMIMAQSETVARSQKTSAPAVVGSVLENGDVRFSAPGQVLEMQIGIYSSAGQPVFNSVQKQGSVLDVKQSDILTKLNDGKYLCVVTIKDLQNKTRKRIGMISSENGRLILHRADKAEISAALTQNIELTDGDESFTVYRSGREKALTLATNDGEEGKIVSTKGDLTLRTGDYFAGTDKEQMRVTTDGRVGIGTNKPEATLDVNGTVRARGGIVFEDGTSIKSATELSRTTGADAGAANAAGTGTTGKIAKWTDGANGVIGDSAISENASGNISIGGQPHATTKLDVTSPAGTVPFRFTQNALASQNPSLAAFYTADGLLGQYAAASLGGTPSFLMGAAAGRNFGLFANNSFLSPQLFLRSDGNIGIGTINPSAKLEVAGSLKLSGQGSGITFSDGSVLTTASGAGGTMSGTSIISAINDPAASGFIGDNRISPSVARLNGANNWTGSNIFSSGLSANNSPVTNVANPVNAGDATNKAYTDANFVKFVPGAEQLSVGDANGTAPMINLRGGSTCCSGPGGHTPAWFKVFQNGSFVATGNLGIGVSPMQGKGYRTSWDSYKGAFRSGYADAEWDDANVGFFSWAGGSNSTAIGLYALAFGDTNQAESTSSIVFGSGNQVKGAAGFAAGAGNRVCDTYGVALGNNAKSGGPIINGKCDPDSFNITGLAAVAIGYNVTADKDHSTAMGKFASNNGFSGTFIWSDGSATASADTFRNTANNEFAARATGGFRFRTNLGGTTGCNLPAGSGVFNCTSSRYTKENFLDVKGADVLSRLRVIPITSWNYISEGKQVRHLGPMAEDFFAQFGLGTGNTSIGVQDLAGVGIAAVKELDEQLQQKTEEVRQLRKEVENLRAAQSEMEKRLLSLERAMKQDDK